MFTLATEILSVIFGSVSGQYANIIMPEIKRRHPGYRDGSLAIPASGRGFTSYCIDCLCSNIDMHVFPSILAQALGAFNVVTYEVKSILMYAHRMTTKSS